MRVLELVPLAMERQAERGHLEEHHAEGVHVGAKVDVHAGDLLGDMYSVVPAPGPVDVRSPDAFTAARASPKSMSFATRRPSSTRKTFSGFRSR